MASPPDASDPTDRRPSSSVGSTMNSGSGGFDRFSPFYWDNSSSRESSPGPLEIIHDIDLKQYRKEVPLQSTETDASTAFAAQNSRNENAIFQPSLLCGGSQFYHGNAVSHPFSSNSNLSTGNSAFDDGDDEDISDAEFFAQFGELPPAAEVPTAVAGSEIQDDGSMGLLEGDLEAQLGAELRVGGNESMELLEGDLEAQLDAELGSGFDNSTELLDGDLEAQLDAELEAETHKEYQPVDEEEAAEAAQRNANLQEALRIAAEKAAMAIPYDQRDDPSFPTEEELEAELRAADAADEPVGDVTNMVTGMTNFGSVINPSTVKRDSKRQPKKPAKKAARKTAPKAKPKTTTSAPTKVAPGPLAARVGRSQPPPMRKTDELPQLYHLPGTNWNLLRKHMTLSTRVDLNHCYRSLGLDIGRGKALYENLKAYLRIPGNSIHLSAEDVDTEDAKRIIADIAHKLLYEQCWGQTYFDRPSLDSGCKFITYQGDSTEVFLEFTSLVYKAMKLEEKRKKGNAKQQQARDARAVTHHPTSEAFANATYFSPREFAQAPPQAAAAAATNNSPRIVTQCPTPQASAATTRNPPRAVPMHPAEWAFLRLQGKV
ncbi:hypothetical protein N8I77_008213 [Diaporthe amygdali]|uniref:Uncharacterized protein n=1 Tax=Phomopsis amygdali TaxID=1214568 RepID=A0AAD9SEH5_PHOAM|nr:hypothetical protein N8I77_008213 [Diaporthe amygdali]